jgi:colanic acid biosynthesis glycosyl transferase WcaI
VLSYASFYVVALWKSLTLPRPDVVVTLTTPPLLSLLGNLLKFARGSRHFIWEMDIYPDVAVALRYFKNGGIADRVTGILADWSRHHADGIIALGECMKDRLISRGIPAEQILVADNWADSRAISVLPRPGDPNQLVLLYSGNLGLAHDVGTMIGAMRELRNDARFRFIFVGGGARRAELAATVASEHLDSVEFRSYVQRESLSESLSVGDIGLVTQRDDCCGAVVPSKVYGLLAAGRPILFIGPAEATPARIIRRFNCGWHIRCGDVNVLSNLLLHLADSPEEIAAAGARARAALVQHFDLPLGVARVAEIIGANITTAAEERNLSLAV